MEPAGTIVAQEPASEIWGDCDGTYVSSFLKPDYQRRCGGIAGRAGLMGLRKPSRPGFSIRLVDDPDLPDPPPDGWSIDNLPPDTGGAPINTATPYVSQTLDTLNCTMGEWIGEPTSYAYAWQINGNTAGTDSPDYTVQPGDVGGTATCIVTATNASGAGAAPPSVGVIVA